MSILNEVLKLILQTVKAKKKKKQIPSGDINEGRNKKRKHNEGGETGGC